jgi:cyanophycin synthetase
MTVDLERWKDIASNEIDEFTNKLVITFPGLQEHTCSRGYKGGFIERLREGTYMAHIIEHVALELSTICGIPVNFGKTRFAGREGVYEICTTFENEEGMKECLRQAFEIINGLVERKDFTFDCPKIQAIVKETSLGPSGKALVQACLTRGVPVKRIGRDSLLQVGYGKYKKFVQAAVTCGTGLIAAEIAQDKHTTKQILSSHFIPVPEGEVIRTEHELFDFCEENPGPFVVKPLDGNHGRGVSLSLETKDDLIHAFNIAKKISDLVIVEEMCVGRDYRILVVGNKLVAASERRPACVTGNGKKNLKQLIEEVNADPNRGEGHLGVLTKIEVDEIVETHLLKCGIKNLKYVPNKGETVCLRPNANLSSGGTAIDVTDQIHPELKHLCERAARAVGLDICGLDLIHPDIRLAPCSTTKFIEVNAGPGLRMHLAPTEGQSRDVAGAIIDMIYPDKKSRIPIIALTGTNGKTTVARLLHRIFCDQGEEGVGMTSTDGIWIGKKCIYKGDMAGPKSAQLLLSDTSVSRAVLEVARGGILRQGLAYDWSDVSIITNIQPDHIGQNGIDNISDLIWVKSLVAERVKKGGTLVLNADDPNVIGIKDNPRVKRQEPNLFLISAHAKNPHLQKHLSLHGDACWLDNGMIHLQYMGEKEILLPAACLPLTLQGLADFQIYNIMAALAAALSSGAEKAKILQSLREFSPNEENAGRMNLYRIHHSYVVVDYGHNAAAYEKVGRLLQKFKGYKKTAVVGIPGDRSNRLLQVGAAALAEHFDHIIFKDDKDLRGRRPFEVPEFMRSCIQAINPAIPVDVVPDESEAVEKAVEGIGRNEIVFIFIDSFAVVMSTLLKYDPQHVDAIPLEADEAVPARKEYEWTDKPVYANGSREVNRNGLQP